jgi:thiosulfate/3-mercaptopyruvate sulfurtransferase
MNFLLELAKSFSILVSKASEMTRNEATIMKKILFFPLVLSLLGLAVVGCNPKKKDDSATLGLVLLSASNAITTRTVSQLTNESNDDYSRNTLGLISGSTLESWVTNWTANKPSGISGNLIVLQTDTANRITGDSHGGYVPSNTSTGVFVYLLDDYQVAGTTTFRFNQARNAGLIRTGSVRYQANGALVDEWLNTFNINPTRDLVVFVVGTGGVTLANGNSSTAGTTQGTAFAAKATAAGPVQDVARGAYWLRYWGVDLKNIAVLNGNLRSNFTRSQLTTTRSELPTKGTFSVKQLRVDNTAITIGLEDAHEIARTGLKATTVTGITPTQFLVDARPTNQFNGSLQTLAGPTSGTFYITTSWEFSGAPIAGGTTQKFNLFEGGIKGAVDFPWVDLLTDSDTGFQYKSKSELRTIYANKGYTSGATVISQCRTNFEAQVNGFAAINILGYPTAYYDGSLVEWTSLSANHPASSVNQVSSTFKWRTDSDTVSRILWYNGSASDTSRVQSATVDVNATTTKQFIIEDKAYKLQ